jgi:uncharacterized membrane protein
MFGQTGHHFFSSHAPRSLQAMASSLPEARRELFLSRMREAMKESRALYREVREEQKQAQAILNAQPFDQAAYLAHMRQAETLRASVRQRMTLAVADIAEQLTQKERMALDAALKTRSKNR